MFNYLCIYKMLTFIFIKKVPYKNVRNPTILQAVEDYFVL